MAVRLEAKDKELLAFLARYSLITTDVLRRVGPYGKAYGEKRLRDLTKAGYLSKYQLFATGRESYWTLTEQSRKEGLIPVGADPRIPAIKDGKSNFNKKLLYAKLLYCCTSSDSLRTLLSSKELRGFLEIPKERQLTNATHFYFDDDFQEATGNRIVGFIAVSEGASDPRRIKARIEKNLDSFRKTHPEIADLIRQRLFVYTFLCESESKRADIVSHLREKPLKSPAPWVKVVAIDGLAETLMSDG